MSFEGNKEIMFTKIDVAAQSVTMDKSVKNFIIFLRINALKQIEKR